MVRVVPPRPVALGPQPLDEDEGPPALESPRAGFDALHRVRARDLRLVGVADRGVEALDAGGEDGRGAEEGGAKEGVCEMGTFTGTCVTG